MKTKVFLSLTISMAFISLIIILPSLSVAVDEPKIEGMIEVDYPNAGLAKVEVNLTGDMISAATSSMKDKPEVSEAVKFLAKIKSIKVRVYDRLSMKDKTYNDFAKFYEDQLEPGKLWNTVVRVNDENTKVGVYLLKSKRNDGSSEEYIPGLTVIVGSPEQVVAVNIAGDIDIAKLAELSKKMGNKDIQNLAESLGKDFSPKEKEKPKESK